MTPNSLALNMSEPNASMTVVNRKGDRGSPCQMPLEALNNFEGDPLTKTEKDVVEMHSRIHLCQVSPKPNLRNI